MEETKKTTGLSRRAFLGLGAAAAAGAAMSGTLAGCAAKENTASAATAADAGSANTHPALTAPGAPKEIGAWRTPANDVDTADISETLDCDVLVIGLGHAGCTAFRAAAEAGAKVAAMVDQEEDALTFMSGGQVGHINSDFLKSRGVPEVDPVEFMNDWQVRANNRSNPGLIMKYAQNAGRCFDWYLEPLTDEEKAQITIRQWSSDSAQNTRNATNCSGIKCWVGTANTGDFQSKLLQNCIDVGVKAGGKVYYGTKGYKLITDDSGAVTGAIGKSASGYVQVNAAKGVIIASGDYVSNLDMCYDLQAEIVSALGTNDAMAGGMGRDGSGIQMGYWAGGRMDPCQSAMDGAYWYPTDSPTDAIGTTAALWLNADGKRYCNEGFGSTELAGFPGARQPEGIICTLFDNNIEEQLKVQPLGHMSYDYANSDFAALRTTLDAAYAGGKDGSAGASSDSEGKEGEGGAPGGDKAQMAGASVFAADDFETLGGYLGYDGEALTTFMESIERYNELCTKGVDEDFGKDASLLFPLTTPPYYGYAGEKTLGAIMVTTSGLLVDENSQVLGEDYRPVKGLFAAGNASGSRFGYVYFTSVAGESLSIAQTQGMLAGEYVASL